MVVLNTTSGSGDTPRDQIEQAFARANVAADVEAVTGPEIRAAAGRAAKRGQTLVAAGGDGTASTVGSVAAESGVPFGVIPLGTLNHFARDAGIPADVDGAARVIAAGRTRPLDAAEVNGRRFLNNLSLGFYVRIVREREAQQRRGRRKWTAFAIGLAHAWVRYRTMTVRLEVEGGSHVRRTPFVFIGNGDYQAEGLDVGRRCSMTGGRLAVYVAPECGRFDLLGLSVRALAGRLTPDVKLEAFTASQLTIETASARVSAAIDGELIVLRPPLTCVSQPGALRTLLPDA
jgi:diacylglycerol kinase family enzyme